jgi:hypothetical protein
MPANAAIYIPYDTVKLPELFGEARSDGDPGQAATFYAGDVAGDLVSLPGLSPWTSRRSGRQTRVSSSRTQSGCWAW